MASTTTIATRDTQLTFKRAAANVARSATGEIDYVSDPEADQGVTVYAHVKTLSGGQREYRGLQALNNPVEIVVLTDDLPLINGQYVIVNGSKTYKPVSTRELDSRLRQTEITAELLVL